MRPNNRQKTKIVQLFSDRSSADQRLEEKTVENFTKSLLKFEKKLDSFNTAESTCQIASLEDLRGGLKLKLKKPAEEEDAGKVLTIHRVEG